MLKFEFVSWGIITVLVLVVGLLLLGIAVVMSVQNVL
jgi:hypothetical protein